MRNFKHKMLRKIQILKQEYSKKKIKYKYPILSINYNIKPIIEVFLIIFVSIYIFNNQSLLQLFKHIDDSTYRQIVFSQISVTFLTLSLISFLTNLKKDKILGTSTYSIIFSKSILSNITLASLILFFLLFINLFQLFIAHNLEIIVPNFLVSLFILSYLVITIITYTTNEKKGINKISTFYYMENLSLIKKPYKSPDKLVKYPFYLDTLRKDTIEKISKKDFLYELNLKTYAQITEHTLINNKKKVQENYTEIMKKPDITYYWVEHIKLLITKNQLNEALNQYNKLLSILINNEVFLLRLRFDNILSDIIKKIANTKDKNIFDELSGNLYSGMYLTMNYMYYLLNNDFSYTRLGKLSNDSTYLNFIGINGVFLKEYYNLIDKNLNLNQENKNKEIISYLDRLRMTSFNIDSPFVNINMYSDIKFEYRSVLLKEEENLNSDLELIGFPLSLLIYQIVLDKNIDIFYYIILKFKSNSIHFSCSIILGKILKQYFRENNVEKKEYLEEIIMVIMLKLETCDYYKFKGIIYKLNTYNNSNYWSPYYGIYYNSSEHKLLLSAVEAIQIKKYKTNYEKLNIKNKYTKEILALFTTTNKEIINKKISKSNFINFEILNPSI